MSVEVVDPVDDAEPWVDDDDPLCPGLAAAGEAEEVVSAGFAAGADAEAAGLVPSGFAVLFVAAGFLAGAFFAGAFLAGGAG